MNAMNGTATMRPCPVEGCQVLRHAHHLTCVPHWKKLPPALRADVTRTWAVHQAADTLEERRATRAKWFAASTRAISWLNGPVGAG